MKGASDASSVAWGGVVYALGDKFEGGGTFPADWLSKHIIQKEIYALHDLLVQLCKLYSDTLSRASR